MSEPYTAIQRGERRLSDTTQFKNTESYRSTLSYIQRHNTIWSLRIDNLLPLFSNSTSFPGDGCERSAGRRHSANSSVEKCAQHPGLCCLFLYYGGLLPAGQCRALENTAVLRDGAAACPFLGTLGTPVRELDPGSTQQLQEQLSAAWTALGTAQTQCWPGHQVSLPPLTGSAMGVLAST